MNERDLLHAYPAYAPAELCEIFEPPVDSFAKRFPGLALYWEPFLKSWLDRDFDIDTIRKVAADIGGFLQWLLGNNEVVIGISPSLIDEFIRDLRKRFRKKNEHATDPRTSRDVRGAIECFLAFAAHKDQTSRRASDGGGSP